MKICYKICLTIVLSSFFFSATNFPQKNQVRSRKNFYRLSEIQSPKLPISDSNYIGENRENVHPTKFTILKSEELKPFLGIILLVLNNIWVLWILLVVLLISSVHLGVSWRFYKQNRFVNNEFNDINKLLNDMRSDLKKIIKIVAVRQSLNKEKQGNDVMEPNLNHDNEKIFSKRNAETISNNKTPIDQRVETIKSEEEPYNEVDEKINVKYSGESAEGPILVKDSIAEYFYMKKTDNEFSLYIVDNILSKRPSQQYEILLSKFFEITKVNNPSHYVLSAPAQIVWDDSVGKGTLLKKGTIKQD